MEMAFTSSSSDFRTEQPVQYVYIGNRSRKQEMQPNALPVMTNGYKPQEVILLPVTGKAASELYHNNLNVSDNEKQVSRELPQSEVSFNSSGQQYLQFKVDQNFQYQGNQPQENSTLKNAKETVIEITEVRTLSNDNQNNFKIPTSSAMHIIPNFYKQQEPKIVKLNYDPMKVSSTDNSSMSVSRPICRINPTVSQLLQENRQPQQRGFHIVLPPTEGSNKNYTVVSTTLSNQGSSEDDSGCNSDSDPLNTSLTNIQWLGSMTGDTLVKTNRNVDHRVFVSEQQIQKVSKECGKAKRPPFSYMSMIQMAINSKPDKRMTLREIYCWVESTFTYYKYTAKQGWKNSIRHNLSLYDIFVRERVSTPGLVGSYWTLKSTEPSKVNAHPKRLLPPALASKADKEKPLSIIAQVKGPNPTNFNHGGLSNVDASGGWTLVPVNILATQGHCSSDKPVLGPTGLQSSLKRPASDDNTLITRKHVKIAPKVSIYNDATNGVTQAWINASLSSSNFSDLLSLSGLSPGPSAVQSSNDSGIESQSSAKSGSDTSMTLVTPHSFKSKKQKRKKRPSETKSSAKKETESAETVENSIFNVNLSDSFLAGLENEFASPLRRLLQTPPKVAASHATSTPYKTKDSAFDLGSPIRGLSPLSKIQDSMFTPVRNTSLGLLPLTPEGQRSSFRSPKMGSLREFGLGGFTPLQPSRNNSLGNHSLSKIFGDLPLDVIMEENNEIDMANLSWSDM